MTTWTVDAVVERALRHDEDALDTIIYNACQPEWTSDKTFHVPCGPDGVLSAFGVAKRDGTLFVHSKGMHLGPGVIYRSECTTIVSTAGMGNTGPTITVPVVSPASVAITGTVMPDIVLEAMIGRIAISVVDHDVLDIDGLTIIRAGHETRQGNPTGFYIILPQLTLQRERGRSRLNARVVQRHKTERKKWYSCTHIH